MNENILVLNDLNTGNNIKQGDRTILKYLCDDGNGDSLDLTGKLARAVLKTRKNEVIYQTEAQINDRNEVTFVIDQVIPANQYVIEIVVDDQYIFPSDNTMYLNVTKSSLGAFEDYINETPREELYKAIDERIGDHFVTKEDVKDHLTIDELKDIYLQDYATTEYVDDKVTGLATTEYVDSLDISDQLTNYATKSDLENIELTEAQKAELKGDPFRYEDFTEEQLKALKGKDGVDGKDGINGVDGKDGKPFTYDDFTPEQLQSLKGDKGEPGQSVKIWKGTGTEYTNLKSTDPNTIYLIKEG